MMESEPMQIPIRQIPDDHKLIVRDSRIVVRRDIHEMIKYISFMKGYKIQDCTDLLIRPGVEKAYREVVEGGNGTVGRGSQDAE